MVDTKTTVQPKQDDNPRTKLQEQRANRLKLIRGDRPGTVKVFPANEDMARVLRHPNGTRFRGGEAAEWPNDSFTTRRIADGSVSTEKSAGGAAAKADETKNAREVAAARKPKKPEEKQQSKTSAPSAA